MPNAFVTGATGFLGRHLIDVLFEAGWKITALVRDEDRARDLLGDRCTFVSGAMDHAGSVEHVMPEGLDCVFHVAADTSTWRKEAHQQDVTNIQGTRSVLLAAQARKAQRMVHVSSFAVYGIHETIITEESDQYGRTSWVNYVRSKTLAEDQVRSAVQAGFDAVIVNPGHIVGAYDDNNWARMIKHVDEGTMPGIPPGSGNFANGRKVAEAILMAYEKGRTGQNYILAGPKESFVTFLSLVSEKLNKPLSAPKRPAWLLKILSHILSGVSALTGKRPILTPEEAYFASEDMVASSAKAVKELGYEEVPLTQSLDEAIAYLREKGSLSGT